MCSDTFHSEYLELAPVVSRHSNDRTTSSSVVSLPKHLATTLKIAIALIVSGGGVAEVPRTSAPDRRR